MNWDWWLYFIYVGPSAIWVLGVTILISTIVGSKNSKRLFEHYSRLAFELEKTRIELKNTADGLNKGATEVSKAVCELQTDTAKLTELLRLLNQGNLQLKTAMENTLNGINNFAKTLRRVYFFHFPLSWFGGDKEVR